MNRFMLMITVATAAILGAHNSFAQTVLYTPPSASSEAAAPLPFGQYIASRITDKDASEFKNWIASTPLQGKVDITKGYTVFAVVDEDFDPSKPEHSAEHYIVNSRVGITTMQGNADEATAINGDKLTLTRTGNSYAVEGKRINGVIKNPEGTIYLIGGPVSAFHL